MKLRITLILLVVAMLPAGYMLGQAIFTPFTATIALLGPPTDTGTFSCPGGQPTGLYPVGPPCTPGSRFHFRGVKFPWYLASSDDRMTGFLEITMNGNTDGWRTDLNGPGSGQLWGTHRLEVAANGNKTGEVWEGTWTGNRTVRETGYRTTSHNVLHGSGGRIEGLKVEFDTIDDPEAGLDSASGWILAPPGKSGK